MKLWLNTQLGINHIQDAVHPVLTTINPFFHHKETKPDGNDPSD